MALNWCCPSPDVSTLAKNDWCKSIPQDIKSRSGCDSQEWPGTVWESIETNNQKPRLVSEKNSLIIWFTQKQLMHGYSRILPHYHELSS